MKAFDFVYEQYSHKLYSFICKILKNEAEAEEIVQEVFIRLWESRFTLEETKPLNSYVFTIAYNHSIDLIRKRVNSSRYLEHLKKSSLLQSTPSFIGEIEYNELSKRIEKLIEQLPERQKQVYRLHREEGLAYSDIAEKLGISVNTISNHMTKALKYLRDNLDDSLFINLLFITLFL